jgi:hypothetical protein
LGFIACPTPTYAQTGGRGNMFVGDGTDDKVDVGNVGAFNFERTTAFTIETWFKTTSNTNSFLTKVQQTLPARGYGLGMNTGNIFFSLINNANPITPNLINVRTNATFADNNWHHVAATYDGSSNASGVIIYVDGVQQATTTLSNNLSATIQNTESVFLGASLTGNQDETRVWNTVRTQAQIRENMHLALPASTSGLLAYYQFNESAGQVIDAVNGNNGTLLFQATRIPSTVSVARGTSVRQTISQVVHPTTSDITFGNLTVRITGMTTPASGDEFVAYQLQENPLNVPSGVSFTSNYWLIRQFGSQTFSYDQALFTIPATNRIAPNEETGQPGIGNLKLYKRNTNSGASNWGSEIGTAIEASNTTKIIKYALSPEQTSFSEFLPSSSGSSPLPVTLLGFTAQRFDNQTVILRWQTLSEINNHGFEVEQSQDGVGFKKIGFVDGSGNSSQLKNYHFSLSTSEAAYYRLRQVDTDGGFTYSRIQFVEPGNTYGKVLLSPNPINVQSPTIRLELPQSTSGEIVFLSLYSPQGSLLTEKSGTLSDLAPHLLQTLDRQNQGYFLLRMRSKVGVFEQKIIKN